MCLRGGDHLYENVMEDRFKAWDAAAEKEIAAFEEAFKELGNEALAKPEKAILKTYLLWRMKQQPDLKDPKIKVVERAKDEIPEWLE